MSSISGMPIILPSRLASTFICNTQVNDLTLLLLAHLLRPEVADQVRYLGRLVQQPGVTPDQGAKAELGHGHGVLTL